MFIPLIAGYAMGAIYMGMEEYYNVMFLHLMTVLWVFFMYLFGMIITIVIGKWFSGRSNFKIIIPSSGTPIVVESQSHVPAPSSAISTIKYRVCECSEDSYHMPTGIVFRAYTTQPEEFLVLSGVDVKFSVDNKIFLNGTLSYYEEVSEWRVKLQLDYDDEQKAYMMLMIKTLQLFSESQNKIITGNVDTMEEAMKKTLNIINVAYDLILPAREKGNIPLQGGNTEIERIKADRTGYSKKDIKALKGQVESLQKDVVTSK